MWNLRVICLFLSVFAFVSSPILCLPVEGELYSQPPEPIILITAPLDPGEVVVLGDDLPTDVVKEIVKEVRPLDHVEDLTEIKPNQPVNDDRKPVKPAGKPQKPRPQRPSEKPEGKPQKPKPKPQKPGGGSGGRPQKPGGGRPQRPTKPQKPGKPQQKPQKPNRPQRPPGNKPDIDGDDLKTETTTYDYEYDLSTIEPSSHEIVEPTSATPDFAVPDSQIVE